jgi:peroxiredoxin (alkyl hydroperoxide reductase subunit C)
MISNNNGTTPTQPITIGRVAPDFTALTTQGPITLSQFRGKWVLLFSHPGDFTPVCTSEFIAFSQLYDEFINRNVQLIGISIDSNPAHLGWFVSILENSGITIPFPLIADRNAEVSTLYGMVNPDRIYETSVRDVFIIDPVQRIRSILAYPATNGRNMYELLRLIDALQVSTEYRVSTPANWMPGDPVIVPVPSTFDEVLKRINDPESLGLQCKDWYYCYKNYDDVVNQNTLNNIPAQAPAPAQTPAPAPTTTPATNSSSFTNATNTNTNTNTYSNKTNNTSSVKKTEFKKG